MPALRADILFTNFVYRILRSDLTKPRKEIAALQALAENQEAPQRSKTYAAECCSLIYELLDLNVSPNRIHRGCLYVWTITRMNLESLSLARHKLASELSKLQDTTLTTDESTKCGSKSDSNGRLCVFAFGTLRPSLLTTLTRY